MNLVIDIGNTYSKVAFFKDSNILEYYSVKEGEFIGDIGSKLINQTTGSIICSVKKNNDRIEQYLKELRVPYFHLKHNTKVPIQNKYATPETLGMDRLASVVGGKKISGSENVLSIDCGTCITYDYLDHNKYIGGKISPGIDTKFKALHNFTDKLPLVEKSHYNPKILGATTEQSILKGVIEGTILEIKGTIEDYKRINNNLAVILTGGDSEWLKKYLKNIDIQETNLVLIGLNEILEFNKKI